MIYCLGCDVVGVDFAGNRSKKVAAHNILSHFQLILLRASAENVAFIHIETICTVWEAMVVDNITYSLLTHLGRVHIIV